MQIIKRILPASIALVALSSCGGDGQQAKAPTGQVAATVGNREITSAELRAEAGGATLTPEQQSGVLDAVVNRVILAGVAQEGRVDADPEGAIALQRARELALIELLQAGLTARVPKVTDDEARAYVQNNPDLFAQRRLLTLEQIVAPSMTPQLIKATEPLATIPEIQAFLDQNGVAYYRTVEIVDPLGVRSADAKASVVKMEPGYVFQTPTARGMRFSRVASVQPMPITGAVAQQIALSLVGGSRVESQVRAQMQSAIEKGKTKVQRNPAFAPAGKAAPAAAGT